MIQLTVMYPNEPGKKFNMDYYINSHIHQIVNVPGGKVIRASVAEGIASMEPGKPADFICIANILYESIEDMMATFALLPNIAEDFPNYSEVTPVIQISEVKM